MSSKLVSIYVFDDRFGIAVSDTTVGGARILRECDVIDGPLSGEVIESAIIRAAQSAKDGIAMPEDLSAGYFEMLRRFGNISDKEFTRRAKCVHVEVDTHNAVVTKCIRRGMSFVSTDISAVCKRDNSSEIGSMVLSMISKTQ